jgi:hypothetical protein
MTQPRPRPAKIVKTMKWSFDSCTSNVDVGDVELNDGDAEKEPDMSAVGVRRASSQSPVCVV